MSTPTGDAAAVVRPGSTKGPPPATVAVVPVPAPPLAAGRAAAVAPPPETTTGPALKDATGTLPLVPGAPGQVG